MRPVLYTSELKALVNQILRIVLCPPPWFHRPRDICLELPEKDFTITYTSRKQLSRCAIPRIRLAQYFGVQDHNNRKYLPQRMLYDITQPLDDGFTKTHLHLMHTLAV